MNPAATDTVTLKYDQGYSNAMTGYKFDHHAKFNIHYIHGVL